MSVKTERAALNIQADRRTPEAWCLLGRLRAGDTSGVEGCPRTLLLGAHGGAELDLVWIDAPGRIGVEIKYTSAPRVTKSMRVEMADLSPDRLYVVHPTVGRAPNGM